MLEQHRADLLATELVRKEIQTVQAEGTAAAKRIIADAELYEQQQRAEGTRTLLLAQGSGIGSVIDACRGDAGTARFYLALKKGIYETLAKEQAHALQGLNPTISVWNTGP